MTISRRSFFKGLFAAAVSLNIKVPAFAFNRQPYVNVGEVVDYIGPRPGFVGGYIVKEILERDEIGYPVVIQMGFGPTYKTYYDIDLACFQREIPRDFWHHEENKIYNNVHTWLRMQRYGETLTQAVEKLNFAS